MPQSGRQHAEQPRQRWRDLRARVLSGAILIPLALGCVWADGFAFALLVALVTIVLSYEWLSMVRWPFSPVQVAVFGALPVSVGVAQWGYSGWALIFVCCVTAAAATLRPPGTDRVAAFGVPYIGVASIALVWLRHAPEAGRINVLLLLLVVWASDIGAYVAGRAMGGPKLAPAISPGKTVSGAVGGLIAAVAIGVVSALTAGDAGDVWRDGLLAGLTGVVAQAGDLFESWLKRRFGVKDSGNLIPGHGGAFDRLDAVLTASPFAALLALILGRGVVIWQ